MKTIEKFGCQSMTGKIEAILIKKDRSRPLSVKKTSTIPTRNSVISAAPTTRK